MALHYDLTAVPEQNKTQQFFDHLYTVSMSTQILGVGLNTTKTFFEHSIRYAMYVSLNPSQSFLDGIEVSAYIGMTTNNNIETRNQFISRLLRHKKQDMLYAGRKRERELRGN